MGMLLEPQRKVYNSMWLKKGSRRPIVAKCSQGAEKFYIVFSLTRVER